MYAVTPSNPVGHLPLGFNNFQLPSATETIRAGTIVNAFDPYWGGAEFIFARANGTIDIYAPCVFTPALVNGVVQLNATEAPNTANLAKMIGVAQQAMVSGDFGWFMISGVGPVASNASVAADTAIGIAAAGLLGALAAGKQLVNARNVLPATTTLAKTGVARSGSTQLRVSGVDGWFVGIGVTGTGIPASTEISAIDPDGRTVTLNAATTAAVNGTVTGTYNDGTVYYNIVHMNRSFAQGAIT